MARNNRSRWTLAKRLAGAFGTLMALEPAFALVIGFLALSQVPNGVAVVGILLVVAAGIGAERSGDRAEVEVEEPDPLLIR